MICLDSDLNNIHINHNITPRPTLNSSISQCVYFKYNKSQNDLHKLPHTPNINNNLNDNINNHDHMLNKYVHMLNSNYGNIYRLLRVPTVKIVRAVSRIQRMYRGYKVRVRFSDELCNALNKLRDKR